MAKKFYTEDNEAIPSIVFKDTKPSGFTEITDQAELSRLYLKQNNKLKEDGKEYTANFKVVSFGVSYRDGTLSDSSVDYLYTKLAQIILRLEDGNWDSALYYLNNHLNTISQDDINNGYSQAIHDQLVSDLTAYINNI